VRALVILALVTGVAHAEPATPVRVSLFCESYGRTKTCSAFITGFIEANKLLISAPRASADVLLYVNANEVALVDKVHLRFVSHIPGTPPVIELDVDIDTRADDDTQRAQLEPAFLRGLALYVAARYPSAVGVTITPPEGGEVKKPQTTPYGFSLDLGGNGNYTENFQSYSAYSSASVTRTTPRDKAIVSINGNGGVNRQPPLVVDGNEINLDTTRWSAGADLGFVWLWNRCWSVGAFSGVYRDDDKGQFDYNWQTKLGLEWDRFKPDDARGNKLALAYFAGYSVERYYIPNVLHESFAQYPTHEIAGTGTVRKDKITLGLSLLARAEMIHPSRRYTLSASPSVEIQVGDHIDVGAGFSIAKRELPAPDETRIPEDDYERRSRLSYADPLQINGYINVRIHWDRTNGARNDRFDNL
jgi:hypothetical protein